jgi:hypothetical protein
MQLDLLVLTLLGAIGTLTVAAAATALDSIPTGTAFEAFSKSGFKDERCSLSNLSIRREWHVKPALWANYTKALQACSSRVDEGRLHSRCAVSYEQTTENSNLSGARYPKPLR